MRAFSETIEGYAQSINMMKEHLAWVKDETTEAHKFFTHQVRAWPGMARLAPRLFGGTARTGGGSAL